MNDDVVEIEYNGPTFRIRLPSAHVREAMTTTQMLLVGGTEQRALPQVRSRPSLPPPPSALPVVATTGPPITAPILPPAPIEEQGEDDEFDATFIPKPRRIIHPKWVRLIAAYAFVVVLFAGIGGLVNYLLTTDNLSFRSPAETPKPQQPSEQPPQPQQPLGERPQEQLPPLPPALYDPQ